MPFEAFERDHHEASTRRIVTRALILVLPLVAGAVALPWLLGEFRPGGASARAGAGRTEAPTREELAAARTAEQDLAEAERPWRSSEIIAPHGDRLDANGELTAPFRGFAVSVDAVPEGARVLVNGLEVGEAPIVASVSCSPGAPVEVRVEKPPYRALRRSTRCRADTLVKLSVRLER